MLFQETPFVDGTIYKTVYTIQLQVVVGACRVTQFTLWFAADDWLTLMRRECVAVALTAADAVYLQLALSLSFNYN